MSDVDRELKRSSESGAAGRARQRKLRREGGSENEMVPTASLRKNGQPRSTNRKGPTAREHQAASQIHLPDQPSQTFKDRQSGRHGSQPSRLESASRKAASLLGTLSQQTGKPKLENRYQATSRAETQRVRSLGQEFKPQKSKRSFEARSEAKPPVMVRGGMGGMSFGRKTPSRYQKQYAPRRRFDVPLHSQGAEMRLPSIPMFHLGWRAASLLLVMMTVASLFMIWKAPVFQVTKVEARGIQRLTVSDLNAVMGMFGRSVFTIDPHALQSALKVAFPELSKVSVKIGLPASLKVVAIEREPIISWTQDGVELWVDAEGVSFPPRGTPANPLVRVEGHGTEPGTTTTQPAASSLPGSPQAGTSSPVPSLRLPDDLVKAILALAARMPADTQLAYDSEHGLGWDDPKGWEVYFGADDQDMAMKLEVYQALVAHLESEGIQPALISVEYVHAPYYRMER